MIVSLIRALCVIAALALCASVSAQDRSGEVEVEQLQSAFGFDAVSSEASTDAKPAASTETQPVSEAALTHQFRMRQQTDKYRFAVLLAITAVLAHVVAVLFLSRQRAEAKELATSIMTSTGLIYVIFGTILIVVISSTDQQLTAAIGIMGAVAGYLFGRSRGDQSKEEVSKELRPGT